MFFLQTLFFGSFLAFFTLPLFCYLLFQGVKKHTKKNIFWGIFLVLNLLFLWARFVEPQMIRVQKIEIPADFSLRVAIFSDIHLGIFKDESFAEQVVAKVNAENPDLVFIPGDFVFFAENPDLENLFAPFRDFDAPVFAVLGNHDETEKERASSEKIMEELEKFGVRVLENEIQDFNDLQIAGIGEYIFEKDDVRILQNLSPKKFSFVLAHNPDSTLKFPKGKNIFALSGHTHCGQIRIPLLYKWMIPTDNAFPDGGLLKKEFGSLFLSCGVGEVLLPLRLFNPPTIDILEFQKPTF